VCVCVSQAQVLCQLNYAHNLSEVEWLVNKIWYFWERRD